MKNYLKLAMAAALVATSLPAKAQEAFGIRMGQATSTLKVLKHPTATIYEVAPPRPNDEFDSYMVVATPASGVCKVAASGKDIPDDNYGLEVRSHFDRFEAILNSKYGRGKKFDFLHAGSIWDEPNDFSMALKKKERSLSKFWDREEGSTLPLGLRSVSLQAKSVVMGTNYLSIVYEFDNLDSCMAAKQTADSTGL